MSLISGIKFIQVINHTKINQSLTELETAFFLTHSLTSSLTWSLCFCYETLYFYINLSIKFHSIIPSEIESSLKKPKKDRVLISYWNVNSSSCHFNQDTDPNPSFFLCGIQYRHTTVFPRNGSALLTGEIFWLPKLKDYVGKCFGPLKILK